ncbi:hypothetical protein [Nitrosopumilus sp.]
MGVLSMNMKRNLACLSFVYNNKGAADITSQIKRMDGGKKIKWSCDTW